MAIHQINKISHYVKHLQQAPLEIDILFKDMLIGVTSFFRDPEAFNILKKQVIPALLKAKHPDSLIRIWTVGCSTGEEAPRFIFTLKTWSFPAWRDLRWAKPVPHCGGQR
jgi:two-component system, chemotaxis family, CheB/CheR fusion protein